MIQRQYTNNRAGCNYYKDEVETNELILARYKNGGEHNGEKSVKARRTWLNRIEELGSRRNIIMVEMKSNVFRLCYSI